MNFRIEHSKIPRESFGKYNYNIYKNDQLIATYWHDFRGDDHGIEFANGEKEDSPVGKMVDFIEGGGPSPLQLSEKAVEYLNGKVK